MENTHQTPTTSAQVWEERYQEKQVWSGLPNETLVNQVHNLTVGTALDLGCGEGGDALWLARQGWKVTGVDVSPTALARAQSQAEESNLDITWVAADLATWVPEGSFDLVLAFFLHSPVNFPRATIYSRAAQAVKVGGRLLIVGHATPPPWSRRHHDDADEHPPRFPSPEETLTEAGINESWRIVTAGEVPRLVEGPEGEETTIYDSVIHAQRLI